MFKSDLQNSSQAGSEAMTDEQLKHEILKLTGEYVRRVHRKFRPVGDELRTEFDPQFDQIPYAGRCFDENEVQAAVESSLDFWLTLGKQGERFERTLAEMLNVRRTILCNSGSSANLLAISALTSPKIADKRRLRPGDEVITAASGFPTTVAPIIQNRLVPVFIDSDPTTLNGKCEQLELAYRPGKTKAVMMAHALGNPFDISQVVTFCKKYDLWLIEDNCDALGSTYTIPASSPLQAYYPKDARNDDGSLTKWTGSWGDLSTQSFYPPHHITMGEGGAVNVVSDAKLIPIVESFRDWGRDCWCASGQDNTCGKRFTWKLGELPEGYDHKYVYSHLGYNLKPLDLQAAVGLAQLKKLPQFVEARKRNWHQLRSNLVSLEELFEFVLPTHAIDQNSDGSFMWDATGCRSECSWFGFTITVREDSGFTRSELARHLDNKKIGNRSLFGGNLLRQPALIHAQNDNADSVRVAASLTGADRIMNQCLFVGCYPGLTGDMIQFICEEINLFCHARALTPHK